MTFSRNIFASVSILLLGLSLGSGCANRIGDDCLTSVDCSPTGARICDTAQPNGYCTIRSCDPDTCPEDEALCVEFRAMPDRTAQTYCMEVCDSDGDCRAGYVCVADNDERLSEGYPSDTSLPSIARVIDLEAEEGSRFCVADPAGTTPAE